MRSTTGDLCVDEACCNYRSKMIKANMTKFVSSPGWWLGHNHLQEKCNGRKCLWFLFCGAVKYCVLETASQLTGAPPCICSGSVVEVLGWLIVFFQDCYSSKSKIVHHVVHYLLYFTHEMIFPGGGVFLFWYQWISLSYLHIYLCQGGHVCLLAG